MYHVMAKKFACSDVVSGCSWSTIAKDESDLFHKISEHAKHVHKMDTIPDEILTKVKSKIQEV